MKVQNRKPLRLSRSALTLIALCLLVSGIFIQSRISVGGQAELLPAIILNKLTFDMPENAGPRFDRLVNKTGLKKQFKPCAVNSQAGLESQPWRGRVRLNDVSYQALFSIDESRIILEGQAPQVSGLSFSIYHPPGSELAYSVTVEVAGTRTIAEKSLSFDEPGLYREYIPFVESLSGDVTVSLSTGGRGVGAWVNPRFHQQKENPRVFILMVWDTLRYDHTSVYGYHRQTTPNLERLAEDGVTYGNVFTSTSWTLPAHVSLFSGKDLSEHGVTGPQDMIGGDIPLAAEFFQQEGFVTAAFTGGGFVEDGYGFHRGFQYYSNVPGNVFSMNSAERVYNHFKNYLDTSGYWRDDLFIFLHTYQIHAPYKAPRSYIDRIDQSIDGNLLGVASYIKDKSGYYRELPDRDRQRLIDLYDASILYTDDAMLGQVIALLKEKGLYARAMLTVLSDHGEEFHDHGSWEHGHSLYNELIKIPLVIKYPFGNEDLRRRGVREEDLTSICDIPGIMLKESGIRYDAETFKVLSGQTDRILPVLFPVSPIIKQFPRKYSLVDDRYHFIYNDPDPEQMAFFNPPPPKIPAYELYRRDDVGETENLYKKRFKVVTEFKKPLKLYLDKLKRLKRLKRKNKTLDKDLERKLKSLGYLN